MRFRPGERDGTRDESQPGEGHVRREVGLEPEAHLRKCGKVAGEGENPTPGPSPVGCALILLRALSQIPDRRGEKLRLRGRQARAEFVSKVLEEFGFGAGEVNPIANGRWINERMFGNDGREATFMQD